MKPDLGVLLQQAQKMQEKMQQAQEELAELEVQGEAGGGLVQVTMTGQNEVRRIRIDEVLIADDRDMLEDVVAAAVNDTLRKVKKVVEQKYAGMGSGLGLPAGLKLPF
jgi:DNA-binding YbaB/EbfC family protein